MVKTIIQLAKFGLIGLLNTLLSLGTIYLLMNLLRFDYRIANICGYVVGLINSFLWNKYWTFRSDAHILTDGIKFAAVFGVCYGIQFLGLLLLVEKLKISENISQPIAMVVYTGLNFILNKLITFRKKKE